MLIVNDGASLLKEETCEKNLYCTKLFKLGATTIITRALTHGAAIKLYQHIYLYVILLVQMYKYIIRI